MARLTRGYARPRVERLRSVIERLPMKISAAECRVMETLWLRGPSTSECIIANLCEAQGWTQGTVKVLISRLLKKQAISATAQGRRYLYSPLISRQAYVVSEVQGLLDRLFNGRLAPLVAHLSKFDGLHDEDLAELKILIEQVGK